MKKIFAILFAAAAMATACNSASQAAEEVNVNGGWELVTLNGADVTIAKLPNVEFAEDGTYHAFTGVNIVNGEYTFEDGVLTIGEGRMTMMAGPEEETAIEQALMGVAGKALTVVAEEDTLKLTDAEGNVVAVLKSAEIVEE